MIENSVHPMHSVTATTLGRLAAMFGLVLMLAVAGGALLMADVAGAQTPEQELEQKAQWQERYRVLLQTQETLRSNAEKSRDNYARAQRRNYPRGGARQQFILDAEKAEKELVKVKAETEEMLDQARREAIPQNWFYEVDDEPIQPLPAASTTDGQGTAAAQDREGRNPLYFKD